MQTGRLLFVVVLASCGGSQTPPPSPPIENKVEPTSSTPVVAEDSATLAVLSVEPAKGASLGGTYVRIVGRNFLADGPRMVKVYFGARQGTVVRFASDTELIVEAPGGTGGETVDIVLQFEPGGTRKLPGAFTFVDAQP